MLETIRINWESIHRSRWQWIGLLFYAQIVIEGDIAWIKVRSHNKECGISRVETVAYNEEQEQTLLKELMAWAESMIIEELEKEGKRLGVNFNVA